MNKLIKSIGTLLMAGTVILAVTGCTPNTPVTPGGEKPENPPTDKRLESPESTLTPTANIPNLNTTHIFNVSQTGKDLVTDGKSDYAIVYTPGVSDVVVKGCQDLQYFIGLSSGCQLEVLPETEFTWSESLKVISVGETALMRAAGLSIPEEMKSEGFRIVTKGNSVFLMGKRTGARNAVYEFLKRVMDWECYAADEIVFTKNTTLPLLNFDITDIPDINYRVQPYGALKDVALGFPDRQEFFRRLRYNTEDDLWMDIDGVPWHNTFAYLPPEIYKAEHPKWYSDDGLQLCYYAHGDEKEAELMFDTFMKKFISVVEKYPERDSITITHRDYDTWCTCPACRADFDKYGTDSGNMIKFCNKVSDAYEAYKAEKGIERDINICFFAYFKAENAPVRWEGNRWVPIDEDIICRDNVFVYYAPISASYSVSMYEPVNRKYHEIMDKWQAVSRRTYYWIYSTNFTEYLMPFNSFNSMQENYMFGTQYSAEYLFDNAQYNIISSTGWSNLKIYLNGKLLWNCLEDSTVLTDNFFKNYYKDASVEMQKMFNYYRIHVTHLEDDLGLGGAINQPIVQKKYWPHTVLKNFFQLADEAYAAIEHLKTDDPELYELLYDRICMETIPYRYLEIELYSDTFEAQALTNAKLAFKEDTTRLSLTRFNEWNDISLLWSRWGI